MRGLLVIEPLYHQIIAGKKTQTRRSGGLEAVNKSCILPGEETSPLDWRISVKRNQSADLKQVVFCNSEEGIEICKPRYKVDEILYLKEPYRLPASSYAQMYKFSLDEIHRDLHDWKNKMFMPAKLARAFIKITGIRCERLLFISDEDCEAEGIELVVYEGWKNYDIKKYPNVRSFGSPRSSFKSLFRVANKMKVSEEITNIWVWVYTFEYLEGYKP